MVNQYTTNNAAKAVDSTPPIYVIWSQVGPGL
jgi:hypothetical protein